MEGLSLTEEEEGGMVYHVDNEEDDVINFDLCLVGRFATDKSIRTHIMKERLAAIWRPVKGVSIQEVEPRLFLFQFYHKIDLARILDGGLWSFDNYMLVLGRLPVRELPEQVPLHHLCIWVQVHGPCCGPTPWQLHRGVCGI